MSYVSSNLGDVSSSSSHALREKSLPRANTKNAVAIDLIDFIALVGLIDVINLIEARAFQLVAVDIHCRERLELAHTGACEDRSHLEVQAASYT